MRISQGTATVTRLTPRSAGAHGGRSRHPSILPCPPPQPRRSLTRVPRRTLSRMAAGGASGAPGGPEAVPGPAPADRYAERLAVPWWWWLGTAALAGVLAAELWLGATGVRAWVPFALLLPATLAGLWWLGRVRVAVTGADLL